MKGVEFALGWVRTFFNARVFQNGKMANTEHMWFRNSLVESLPSGNIVFDFKNTLSDFEKKSA